MTVCTTAAWCPVGLSWGSDKNTRSRRLALFTAIFLIASVTRCVASAPGKGLDHLAVLGIRQVPGPDLSRPRQMLRSLVLGGIGAGTYGNSSVRALSATM